MRGGSKFSILVSQITSHLGSKEYSYWEHGVWRDGDCLGPMGDDEKEYGHQIQKKRIGEP